MDIGYLIFDTGYLIFYTGYWKTKSREIGSRRHRPGITSASVLPIITEAKNGRGEDSGNPSSVRWTIFNRQ
jgi:hypothetical protein